MDSRYEQGLDYWYGRINYELVPPCPDDLRLDRMRELLRRLGNPHERLRIIHVAGSKGKGSTSAMLAAILGHAGYRTGLFTSPHLCRVEERFQVDDTPISTDELTELLADVQRAAKGAPTPGVNLCHPDGANSAGPLPSLGELLPTFFEVATAVGFLHFARRRVDVAIVEVGLGGRFDSTNVCRPLVALITSISFDHTRQLGNRLASIAFEKAGIVKPGRPVVSGATGQEATEVIERICRERKAPLARLGEEFSFTYQPGQVTATSDRKAQVRVVTERQTWPDLELNLLGEHQAANAAVAIRCVECLREQGLSVPEAAVRAGLAEVRWPARMEVLGRRPLVVLDCAHNVASVQALVDTLNASFPPGRRLLVLACSTDKDLAGMLRVLAGHFSHVYLTRFRSNPRSAPPEQLAGLLRQISDLPYSIHAEANAAWQAARAAAGPNDLICIAGSVFLAGELRPVLLGDRAR
jgi:dihydrofolate synthase/folylpolyglutamate synthase